MLEKKTLDLNPGYSYNAFVHSMDQLAKHARIALIGVDYDTMVGTGTSGYAVVPILGRLLNKNWALVRQQESSHDPKMVVGELGHRWIFVDDLISSGTTEEEVKGEIFCVAADNKWPMTYVGRYLYMHPSSDAFFDPDSTRCFEE